MKGTDSCPANWSKVYGGYLLSGHYSHGGVYAKIAEGRPLFPVGFAWETI